VVHAAVTDCDGLATFYVHPDHRSTDAQSLHPMGDERQRSLAVTVPAMTLSTLKSIYCDDVSPSVVKVDIEGAEPAMFRAVPGEWLGSNGPLWIVEINPGALRQFGALPSDVLTRFADESFFCWLMPKHPVSPADTPTLRKVRRGESFADSLYFNLIAIPTGTNGEDRRRRLSNLFPAATADD
jgi:hypothetical protein